MKHHTVRKGMKFLFSNILREEPVLLVMVVLCVLLTLASSVLMVYIPSYAVAVVGSDADSPQWTGVILITVAYVVVSCACSGVQGGRECDSCTWDGICFTACS